MSEGRDPERVARLCATLGSLLLDVHSDPDHHRSVLTAAGTRDELERALVALAGACIDEIDLRIHDGLHPRLGALDVCPIVPLSEDATDDAFLLAAHLAREFAALRLGVYRYGMGARSLPEVRRAAVEGALPDLGTFHPTAGSVSIGVRALLVAFNVDLDPSTVGATARAVAADVRDEAVRTLGLVLPRQHRVQVSMNLVEPERVGVEEAWQRVRSSCGERGLPTPIAAELVGLAPRVALRGLSEELARLTGAREKVLEDALARRS